MKATGIGHNQSKVSFGHQGIHCLGAETAYPSICQAIQGQCSARRYSSLLLTEKGSVPDPKTLMDWEEEKDSMNTWPPTMIMDIGVYLARLEPFRKEGVPFTDRLLSDQDQKAYSYFSSRWLLNIKYHPIQHSSAFCFLKTSYTPSQRIRDAPHESWVLIEKLSGQIKSAFCSCFAG